MLHSCAAACTLCELVCLAGAPFQVSLISDATYTVPVLACCDTTTCLLWCWAAQDPHSSRRFSACTSACIALQGA